VTPRCANCGLSWDWTHNDCPFGRHGDATCGSSTFPKWRPRSEGDIVPLAVKAVLEVGK
jgi:hypothetical protein